MENLNKALQYAEDHRSEALDDLIDFLSIPSISTLSEHSKDMERAGKWIADQLGGYGFENINLLPTDRHPVVYGEHLKAGTEAPTILFYGHYDVQPVDPIEEWESDPFQPEIRNGNIYARGASDMKGQLVAHLKAIEAIVRTGTLPVNLKYMIEGEEEIGSPSLEKFVNAQQERLQCDLCLNGDSSILAADTPSITYSLRGLAYFEIWLQGPRSDLHSGMFGGVVDNPAFVLCDLVSKMKDEDGRILLPGFYDKVRELSDEERAATYSQPEQWWQDQTGAPRLQGEIGFNSSERATARPTLDVNGLLSGFTGEGSKTVLPARAMAKISTRLVADQKPDEVYESMKKFIQDNIPDTVTWELKVLSKAIPAITERDSLAASNASEALQAVWGKEPVFVRSGGSVPVVGLLQEILGVDNLMLGFGLPDDNLHAPNEKFHLPNYHNGIQTFIRFMYLYSQETK